MKHLTEMKPGETLHLRSGRDLELESVTPCHLRRDAHLQRHRKKGAQQ